MKKLFVFIALLFVVSGCDSGTETKTLSCKSSNVQNGVTTKTNYDFKYVDDEIKNVTITYDYTQDATNNNARDVDGINADTDGLDENNNVDSNDNDISSDEVVDGVVGDTIDEAVDTVTDTILDLAGIKNTYENQMATYDGIEGFSYDVDVDSNTQYRVIYKIDMDKISDNDLARFDIDRSFDTAISNYEGLGYTCE